MYISYKIPFFQKMPYFWVKIKALEALYIAGYCNCTGGYYNNTTGFSNYTPEYCNHIEEIASIQQDNVTV